MELYVKQEGERIMKNVEQRVIKCQKGSMVELNKLKEGLNVKNEDVLKEMVNKPNMRKVQNLIQETKMEDRRIVDQEFRKVRL